VLFFSAVESKPQWLNASILLLQNAEVFEGNCFSNAQAQALFNSRNDYFRRNASNNKHSRRYKCTISCLRHKLLKIYEREDGETKFPTVF